MVPRKIGVGLKYLELRVTTFFQSQRKRIELVNYSPERPTIRLEGFLYL